MKADQECLLKLLEIVSVILDEAQVPYVVGGGIAVNCYVGRRSTHDIDIFVKLDDEDKALEALGGAGFTTEKTDPEWIYKAFRDDILVDIIFRSHGNIQITDETITRSRLLTCNHHQFKVMPPEDLVLMKIFASREARPHWYDAVDLISMLTDQFDWKYFFSKPAANTKRTLAFLLFADGEKTSIPNWVIRRLAPLIE